MLNKKDFLKYASKLAFPIMIQNLIGTLVNIADTVMLGYVSQTAMSASSLANQFTFILFCLYYGMATGASVLCAQYWGKGDKKTVERILGLAERISLIVSFVFFVISFSVPATIMKIFTSSPDTIAAGSEYLRVISFSFMFMGFSQVFMSALRSIGKIMLPSVTYIVSLCVNVICNATFIFGLFGFPKLGVTGVALGTVIARITEVLICLNYSLRSSDVRFRIKYFFAKSGILFQDFMKIATPAVINDVVWSLASSAFAAILGHIGDDMVAANAVAVMVVNIGAIACRGFANATTIIVSQELGKDNIEAAREYGKRMLRITMVVSLVGCVIILALRPLILDFYRDKLTETAIYYLGRASGTEKPSCYSLCVVGSGSRGRAYPTAKRYLCAGKRPFFLTLATFASLYFPFRHGSDHRYGAAWNFRLLHSADCGRLLAHSAGDQGVS